MTRFIALTEMPYDRKVIVRVDVISYVTKGRKDDTYVRINGDAKADDDKGRGSYFFVKESVDEVEQMLIPPLPVMYYGDPMEDYRAQGIVFHDNP